MEEWMAHTKAKESGGRLLLMVVGMVAAARTRVTRLGENAGTRWAVMIYAPIVARKSTGPRSITRRSEMNWSKVKKRSRAFFWPTKSSSTTRSQPSSMLPCCPPLLH
jgi:hypothetical protein